MKVTQAKLDEMRALIKVSVILYGRESRRSYKDNDIIDLIEDVEALKAQLAKVRLILALLLDGDYPTGHELDSLIADIDALLKEAE